jgi:exosortase/archaeosortase family protein
VVEEVAAVSRGDRDTLNLTLIASACALLMVLPLVTTFDDFLTGWALQLGANNPLQAIVPVEARMVVSLLGALGIHAAAAGSNIAVWDRSGYMHVMLISWNCIGWQSLVLLGVSFFTGLRGHQPFDARAQVIMIGVAGTMLLNLLRVAAVAGLAATWGQTPALLFHDYGGTLLVIGWLFGFWAFAHRWILPADPSDELEQAIA